MNTPCFVGRTGVRVEMFCNWRVYFVAFSAWFAWLVCWKDLKYGPVRLYLSGFFLPYFVWLLIDKLFQFGQPIGDGGPVP